MLPCCWSPLLVPSSVSQSVMDCLSQRHTDLKIVENCQNGHLKWSSPHHRITTTTIIIYHNHHELWIIIIHHSWRRSHIDSLVTQNSQNRKGTKIFQASLLARHLWWTLLWWMHHNASCCMLFSSYSSFDLIITPLSGCGSNILTPNWLVHQFSFKKGELHRVTSAGFLCLEERVQRKAIACALLFAVHPL